MLSLDSDVIGGIIGDGGIIGNKCYFEAIKDIPELASVGHRLVDETGEAIVASGNVY